MPIALPPSDQSLMVFSALAEEGDDAVGELAEGHRVEGRGVEPVDDEDATAADPIEAFARRSFRGGLGGIESKRRLLDFFPDEGVAEVFRPALADGLRFRAFGEHEERHVSPAARLVEDLFSVGWLSTQTVLSGASSSQRATPVIGNHCPCAYCQTRTEQLTRPAGLVSALRASSAMKAGRSCRGGNCLCGRRWRESHRWR
jgi:hypothetical protein